VKGELPSAAEAGIIGEGIGTAEAVPFQSHETCRQLEME